MIIDKSELPNLRQDLEGASIALRLGTYDVLHAGHQESLDYAASQADVLVVGVMPDEYVSRVKGPERPLNPISKRVATIDMVEEVDYSFITPSTVLGIMGIMRALRPDVYVEGREHAERSGLLKSGFLSLLGVQYEVHEHSNYNSSSSMIARLGREAAAAQSSLGFWCTENGT